MDAVTRLRDRRGVALMLVLWLVVVLGALAAGVVAAARSEVRVLVNVRSRSVARYAAESGIVAAAVRLTELVQAAETPRDQALVFGQLDGLLHDLGEVPLGAGRFQVAVADLNARIDLNNADEQTLLGLFRQFVDASEARALVDALQDWKDQDEERREYGAEIDAYLGMGSPFVPPNRPMLRLDELTRIAGFTDSIADAIAPFVTIWSDGRVNINTAPEPVLAAVVGIGPAGAAAIVSGRERGEVFESMYGARSFLRAARATQTGFRLTRLSTMPKRLLVVSRGWEEGQPLTHEIQAVFQVEGLQLADGPRLSVRYWTERDL